MKTLIVNGSPHKDGNTATLSRHLADGLREMGMDEIKEFALYDMDISPCKGCLQCQSRQDAGCVIGDDMNRIMEAWKDADCIVIASPVYWWHVTGRVKTMMDRWTPLQFRDDPVYFKGKKLVLLLAFNFDSPTGNQLVARMFEDIAQWAGMKFYSLFYCSGKGHVRDDREKLEEALALGRKLARDE